MKMNKGNSLLIADGTLYRDDKPIGTIINVDDVWGTEDSILKGALYTYIPFGFWKRLWLRIKSK